MNNLVREAIDDNRILKVLQSIDDKTNKTTDFKSLMFLVKFNSIYEPPIDTSQFTFRFNPPIILDSLEYEMALMDIETFYSFPNINITNCNIRYYSPATLRWNIIVLPIGTYTIETINLECVTQQTAFGDSVTVVKFAPYISALKCKMSLSKAVGVEEPKVDFTYPNSINTILGFNSQIYNNTSTTSTKTFISENTVNIMGVSSVYINCDLISNSYINGVMFPVIYSFFPNVPPGYKIVEKPFHLVFLPINRSTISQIKVWITDQNGNTLDFRGENISIRFYLRKIPFK